MMMKIDDMEVGGRWGMKLSINIIIIIILFGFRGYV